MNRRSFSGLVTVAVLALSILLLWRWSTQKAPVRAAAHAPSPRPSPLPAWLVASDKRPAEAPAAAVDRRPFMLEDKIFTQEALRQVDILTLADGTFRMLVGSKNGGLSGATSSDGKKFALQDGVLMEKVLGSSSTPLGDGTWRTYYELDGKILSALTRDGVHFTPEPGVRIAPGESGQPDSAGAARPDIVKLPDGRWRLYYDGIFPNPQVDQEKKEPIITILSATSSDGLAFTKDEGVRIASQRYTFPPGHVLGAGTPNVHWDGKQFIMYFAAFCIPLTDCGIHRAVSSDGLRFEMEKQPVIPIAAKFLPKLEQSVDDMQYMPMVPFRLETAKGERIFYFTPVEGLRSAFRPKK